MTAKIYSIVPNGFSGSLVEVEGDKSHGLPGFSIVGMANKTIFESRDRVRSAITNSSLSFPLEKITINLAPADLQKDGSSLDLPIALTVLRLSDQLKDDDIKDRIFVGELSLEGTIRPVHGILNIVEAAQAHGFKEIYLPKDNLAQASLIQGVKLVGVTSLNELFLILKGQIPIPEDVPHVVKKNQIDKQSPCLDDIKGQEVAKRALSIAVAGHHNILISGPPGAGKTLLARVAANLLPDLSQAEQIPVTKLRSLVSTDCSIVSSRPFRSPHHSASSTAILGGGTPIAPGEISLAHLGVLFLDELPEYPRHVLESLRQPLEDRQITVVRAKERVTFPADFMLIATMNPCPCGYYGDPTHACSCTVSQIKAYQQKLSGPLLDRIDLCINVQKVPVDSLIASRPKDAKNGLQTPNSPKNTTGITPQNQQSISEHAVVKNKITAALKIQRSRYSSQNIFNSAIPSSKISTLLHISKEAEDFLRSAAKNLNLSARSFYKTLRVAQTIADYDNVDTILPEHISESLSYRLNFPHPEISKQA
ncbi:YifB family Mg chelatase-like AAA ATPase [Candidatus Saccharibacteria bacterium]|nr:YifB family Mg chelatase-like AAA ATPase [Candidatus Saccharibacteria bacterium]